jgi:hypothetical protein
MLTYLTLIRGKGTMLKSMCTFIHSKEALESFQPYCCGNIQIKCQVMRNAHSFCFASEDKVLRAQPSICDIFEDTSSPLSLVTD